MDACSVPAEVEQLVETCRHLFQECNEREFGESTVECKSSISDVMDSFTLIMMLQSLGFLIAVES